MHSALGKKHQSLFQLLIFASCSQQLLRIQLLPWFKTLFISQKKSGFLGSLKKKKEKKNWDMKPRFSQNTQHWLPGTKGCFKGTNRLPMGCEFCLSRNYFAPYTSCWLLQPWEHETLPTAYVNVYHALQKQRTIIINKKKGCFFFASWNPDTWHR